MELHEEQQKKHGILTVPLKSVDAQVSCCKERLLAFIQATTMTIQFKWSLYSAFYLFLDSLTLLIH